jgi:hypothetical protein
MKKPNSEIFESKNQAPSEAYKPSWFDKLRYKRCETMISHFPG